MTRVLGWDIGGANVKAALADHDRIATVLQLPCPALADPSKFDAAVAAARALLPAAELHAVTMTGELSDVFNNRRQGVAYLTGLIQRMAEGAPVLIYAGAAGLLTPQEALKHPMQVASANWHAAATLLARKHSDALFIDVGTTTTDLLPVKEGQVSARGFTDAERLTEGELIYCGVVRTPVMAIAQTVPFRGRVQRIAAERFATMADIFRLTGALSEDADPFPAADQRGKSAEESAGRLARMLGRDAGDAAHEEWIAVAEYLGEAQIAMIEKGVRGLIEREDLQADAPIIGAGCGRFIAQEIAGRLGRRFVDFGEAFDVAPEGREMSARCAPAVAVALLSGGS
jgi:probable H4MPT-linked C1 transfer pathway protein